MTKRLLASLTILISFSSFGQENVWTSANNAKQSVIKHKSVNRLSFPQEFQLYKLNIAPLRSVLLSVVNARSGNKTIIGLPNAAGEIEQFEVNEASNFEPALQAAFPEIRAFSGKGITDKSAYLKMSLSPAGIQTMIFRTKGPNEYIEPYSADGQVYAVFASKRSKKGLPWVCSTPDRQLVSSLNEQVSSSSFTASSSGVLKTMRLAQSCNGEYANFFGATSAADVALVLAAYNATLTRANGCYEKDFALHLNLIAQTTAVIFYDPATDPYSNTIANWNLELQNELTTNPSIGNAAYDIGHMFGADGGGGNAGCIGCVCVNPTLAVPEGKGSGITSPADGVPQGDNFDIDYVAHEMGHQLGANHTFTHSPLDNDTYSKEVGSGVTIMGYAGITTTEDCDDHSIDIFHQNSIRQVQENLATKSCPVTTSLAGINATPVVNPQSGWTIPIMTPFELTGTATDADAGNVLTYCWEQDNSGNLTTVSANSRAYAAKLIGPNWLTYPATTSGTRMFPRLETVLAGNFTTAANPGGTAGFDVEALSAVPRTLNFRLTVRDNVPYNSATGAVGQTNFTDVPVTVSALGAPFAIITQNMAVSYPVNSPQTVSWTVAGTNAAPFNAANVSIQFSSDGGNTFTTLVASTPNDGSEIVTMPATLTTQGRIKIKAIGNIFFDINNANITLQTVLSTPANIPAIAPAKPLIAAEPGLGQLVIYPNPAAAVLQIRFRTLDGASRRATATIHDSKGGLVLAKTFGIARGTQRVEIPVAVLPAAVYHVILRDDAGGVLGAGKFLKD